MPQRHPRPRRLLASKEEADQGVVMVPTYRQAAAFIKRNKDEGMNPIFTSVSFVGSNALAEALSELGSKYVELAIFHRFAGDVVDQTDARNELAQEFHDH